MLVTEHCGGGRKFASESIANENAITHHGRRPIAYRCAKCRWWHLGLWMVRVKQ